MTKNEWMAEKVGFKRPPSLFGVWEYPDHHRGNSLPDFEHSLDAQVKWVWPKAIKYEWQDIELSPPQKDENYWQVSIIHLRLLFWSKTDFYGEGDTLAEASFNACCEALGWKDKED